jgi:replicative DNA helicase
MDTSNKNKNREQEVSEASKKAKQIAKTLNIPVITLCQLSRAVETRGGGKKPILSDLRDSGSIEQDADLVMFLYRPEYYKVLQDELGNTTKGIGQILIEKNRDGACCTVNFSYNESMTKIYDYNAFEVEETKPNKDFTESNNNKPF